MARDIVRARAKLCQGLGVGLELGLDRGIVMAMARITWLGLGLAGARARGIVGARS